MAILRDFRSGPSAHGISFMRHRSIHRGSELVLSQATESDGLSRPVGAARGGGSIPHISVLSRPLRVAEGFFGAGSFAFGFGGIARRNFSAAATGRFGPGSRWPVA